MTRLLSCFLLCSFLLFSWTTGLCATFDEQLWEKYAEIDTASVKGKGGLAGVYLEPYQLGESTGKYPFADLRVVTDRKEEVPWQIVSRRPEKLTKELKAQMRNLSRTKEGDTWLELMLDQQDIPVNAVVINTPDSDFSRQVQVLGSPDGKTWNTLRKDGVIFDITRGEKLHHTRITFPQASYRHLVLQIANGDAQPLTITEVKVLQERNSEGQTYTIQGNPVKSEINAASKENSIVIHMDNLFPLDQLIIATTEHNFQRSVEVQIRRGNGDWEHWAQGTVFNFDTPSIHESKLAIDIPEVTAREFRLVFKNHDSPMLAVTDVDGTGYRRLLVFKHHPNQKLYLFWGNPLAQQPQYDLAGLIAKQKPDEVPITYLGQVRPNSKFAGNNARLPFTERYKYLLYFVVAITIAGLLFVQYRVFRRVKE